MKNQLVIYNLIKNTILAYEKLNPIEDPELYNKSICEGIQEISINDNLENSLSYFEKAAKIYPNKMEPSFYKFASYIYSYNKSNKSQPQYIELSLQELENARKLSPTNSAILYFKSLMALIFEENNHTIQDLTQAIEGIDEGKAEYYFLRGIAYADLGFHPQAFSDFSVALSFHPKWSECYYNRAICCQILGDIEGALSDFKTSLNLANHLGNDLFIGNFLFGCGIYEEALHCYSKVEENELTAMIEKVKCLIHMKELTLCLATLKRLIEISDQNEDFVNDYNCLLALKYASENFSGGETLDYSSLINKLVEGGKDGLVFKLSDFYFYKAAFCFYEKNYKDAIASFIKANQMKSVLDEIKNEQSLNKNDLLSETNSFTFPEYLYNLIICYLQVITFILFVIKFFFKAKRLFNGIKLVPRIRRDCSKLL